MSNSCFQCSFQKLGLTSTAEAHSCLSAILFRLNAGFVSVIERFTRGRSSSADYQVLLNLSNASRLEAINTFEQLSHRLSRSSLALVHSPEKQPARKSARSSHKKSTPVNRPKHSRSKSAPEPTLAPTPLGPASPDGWVRPKNGRKSSSSSTRSSTPKRSSPKMPQAPPSPPPKKSIQPEAPTRTAPPPPIQAYIPSHQIQIRPTPSPLSSARRDKRKSIMSFASDSTKLGEIPEHKWARPAQFDEKGGFEIRTYYPLEPYQEPEKKKGMFGRLFRR